MNIVIGVKKMKFVFILILFLFIFNGIFEMNDVLAATLEGAVYNENLKIEPNVLLEINTVPQQKYFAVDGRYSFSLSPGNYTLLAKKGNILTAEKVEIVDDVIDRKYILDLFLWPDFIDEEELWNENDEQLFSNEEELTEENFKWNYLVAGILFLIMGIRIIWMRKKYGSLRRFRKKIKAESRKSIEEVKTELTDEPDYLEKAKEIIKEHHGRITQKQLRKEMLYLSEAKISLILTELEHQGLIEKIKKGRGNIILLKKEV